MDFEGKERITWADGLFRYETRASGGSTSTLSRNLILGGSRKTLAPNRISRSPRLKEELEEVLRIRIPLGRDSGKFGLRN
jgi:hypothetical protein